MRVLTIRRALLRHVKVGGFFALDTRVIRSLRERESLSKSQNFARPTLHPQKPDISTTCRRRGRLPRRPL